MINESAHSLRHLPWEGCYNVRDLGGLPLADGRRTAWHSVIRADNLGRLTSNGRQALLDYGVRTIIDLRSPQEIVADPPAVFESEPAAPLYLNLPLEKDDPFVRQLFKQAQTRAEIYNIVHDHYPDAVAEVMRAIADAHAGGLAIHCHSGKDRTGTISALLLRLAGVSPEAAAADYALSRQRLTSLYEKSAPATPQNRWASPHIEPETMLATLEHLDQRYGGVPEYLRQAGLTPEEIGRLRQRLHRTRNGPS